MHTFEWTYDLAMWHGTEMRTVCQTHTRPRTKTHTRPWWQDDDPNFFSLHRHFRNGEKTFHPARLHDVRVDSFQNLFLLYVGERERHYCTSSDAKIGSSPFPSVCNPSLMLSSPVSLGLSHIWTALNKSHKVHFFCSLFHLPMCRTWLVLLK